jgi:protocatechuate 3,4-dioxygenase beta subunit
VTTPDDLSGDVDMLDVASVPCRAWASQEEGPYHRDAAPSRCDIVDDRPGSPLHLGIRLLRPDDTALPDADVEIWHCDPFGRYSGFLPPDPGVIVTAESADRTEVASEEMFLRGRQSTDMAGMVEFRTVYPGWYPGRTVHVHVIVHAAGTVFTTQLYFPEAATDEVFARAPYNERPGRDTTNETDEIFAEGGDAALLDLKRRDTSYWAAACFIVPVDHGGVDSGEAKAVATEI